VEETLGSELWTLVFVDELDDPLPRDIQEEMLVEVPSVRIHKRDGRAGCQNTKQA